MYGDCKASRDLRARRKVWSRGLVRLGEGDTKRYGGREDKILSTE